MNNLFFRSTYLLLYVLLYLLSGCQNTNTPQSERQIIVNQLPPSIKWQVDSLLQIEAMMINSNVPAGIIAEVQGETGLLICERLPEEGITYFEKVLKYNYENKQWNKAAELHFFVAQIYDKKLHQPAQALEHLMKAEALWKQRNADFELANTLQYEAVMEAQLGQMTESKQKINQALDMFQQAGDEYDMHELYFDLAQIHYLDKQPDSSLYYLNKLDTIWTIQRNNVSLFATNNLRLRVLLEAGQIEEANQVYAKNEFLNKRMTLHWMTRLEFFQLGEELMRKRGQQIELAKIEQEYQILKDSLRKEKLVFLERGPPVRVRN